MNEEFEPINKELEKKLKKLENKLNLLDELTEIFYSLPGCVCGGKLHIVLDDGNFRDHDLVFCYRELHQDDVSSEERTIGLAILHQLMLLSPAQRLMWHEGFWLIEDIYFAEEHTVELTDAGYIITK